MGVPESAEDGVPFLVNSSSDESLPKDAPFWARIRSFCGDCLRFGVCGLKFIGEPSVEEFSCTKIWLSLLCFTVCLLRIDASLKLASIVGDDSASCGVRLTSAGEVFSDQASIDA